MSNNLYEEAINAAEQIKEAAEDRVKQQLIEAMSPKIKQLIESNLLEDTDECGEGIDELDESEDQEECGEGIDESEDQEECGEGIEELEISSESISILKNMLSTSQRKKAISEKLENIRSGINNLKKAFIIAENSRNKSKFKRKFVLAYKNLLAELKNIKSSSIIKTDKTLLKEYLQLSKELNNMSRRRLSRKKYLNENLEELLEMNLFEEEEEGEMDLDLDAPEEEEGDMDLDLDAPESDSGSSDDLWDQAKDMSLEDLVSKALSSDEGGEEGEMDLDLDSEDDDKDEVEEGMEEMYEMDMDELEEDRAPMEMEEMYEMDMDELEEGEDEEDKKESMEEGLFLEIDENMLKREINNMRKLREGDAASMAHHFGGGSVDKEMFVDMDDGDLNVRDGEVYHKDVPTPKVEAALRKVMRKNRITEGKNRQLRNALRGMKKQLSEMNLFNAKLLYANKLMQNRDLSIKQQKHIVESLDEAGTLNEAKLLFESLSKSLSRSTNKSGNLNESSNRRTLGSSSRSVRSAQPINESVALDRWATLAGIKK